MSTTMFRMMGVLLAGVLATGLLGGCQNQRLTQERNELYLQNQELQDQLTRAREALDAEMSRNAGLEAELARARAARAAEPRFVTQPPVAANTGFAGIEGIEVERGVGTLTVRVPGDVLFASGRVELRDAAKRTLDQVAGVLQREYPSNKIRVEGYTDTDPIRRSNWKDNLELSLQRAAAVHRYLQTRGISASRMYAAGFGEAQPRATKAASRRVEIVVELQ